MALRDYSEDIGVKPHKILNYSSRNFVDTDSRITEEQDSIKKKLGKLNLETITDLVTNMDNASHDINCVIKGLAVRRFAVWVYNELKPKDDEFCRRMINFCERRISEDEIMLLLARTSYLAHIGDYENAEILVGKSRNMLHQISPSLENEVNDDFEIDFLPDREKKLAKKIFSDFGGYSLEYFELMKSLRQRNKEKALDTTKRLFAYTSALNYVLASAKTRKIMAYFNTKNL